MKLSASDIESIWLDRLNQPLEEAKQGLMLLKQELRMPAGGASSTAIQAWLSDKALPVAALDAVLLMGAMARSRREWAAAREWLELAQRLSLRFAQLPTATRFILAHEQGLSLLLEGDHWLALDEFQAAA